MGGREIKRVAVLAGGGGEGERVAGELCARNIGYRRGRERSLHSRWNIKKTEQEVEGERKKVKHNLTLLIMV